MEDGEWNVRFQFLLRIENTPNLWFGVFCLSKKSYSQHFQHFARQRA